MQQMVLELFGIHCKKKKKMNYHHLNLHLIQNLTQMDYEQSEINNSVRKWAKDLNRHFAEENIELTNKHIRFST